MGDQEFVRAACIGPVRLVDLTPAHDDIRRFTAALAGEGPVKGFMNAASPGLITAFQPNQFYASHEAYLARPRRQRCAPSMRRSSPPASSCSSTAPTSRWRATPRFQDLTEAEFVRVAAANVEALNAATANIAPERMRMHVCWGNYEGPHDHDIPLERVIDIVLAARPATILFEAANPRHEHEWTVWAGSRDSRRQAPRTRRDRHLLELPRTPRS